MKKGKTKEKTTNETEKAQQRTMPLLTTIINRGKRTNENRLRNSDRLRLLAYFIVQYVVVSRITYYRTQVFGIVICAQSKIKIKTEMPATCTQAQYKQSQAHTRACRSLAFGRHLLIHSFTLLSLLSIYD